MGDLGNLGDYGWDFAADEGGDLYWTVDGDLAVVEGGELVAADVRTDALTAIGSLFYDAKFGKGLIELIEGPGSNPVAVVQNLREAALDDERIDWETVQAGQYETGRYYLKFQLLHTTNEQTLLFDTAGLIEKA